MGKDPKAQAIAIVKKLIRCEAKLEKKGGPEADGELFEEVVRGHIESPPRDGAGVIEIPHVWFGQGDEDSPG